MPILDEWPSPASDIAGEVSGQDERVPHWLSEAEDGLDAATTAMLRIRELDDQWRAEFEQDRSILRDKLAILRTLINGR
ncbi:MAG: hypothetical protein J2P30_16705 [Actinobacteria bacterium]|nr:hypothetical protein [Actinomycetota bacterium]